MENRPVFEGVSADVAGPGVVRLDGPNGAGKSTLVELCSGYLEPMAGCVYVDGLPAGSRAAMTRRTVCRSSVSAFPEMSVLDHVNLTCALRGWERAAAMDWVERYELSDWVRERAKNLSAGSLRKLWLFMCWPVRQSVWILDEPFQGLDGASVMRLCEDIRMWSRSGLAVVVAHDWPVGGLECGTLIGLERGEC
ncbi:MAG: ATP-binding cassette domain-containing protein [Propionibacteriaceae bacterium]|nr:ATP-binding cassette domain-containing protein [Propionibacteriaceae bacterium]